MASGDVSGLAGWVVDVLDRIGAPGVGALIALENVFPPIPSEVILPFAGLSAARGDLDPVPAWLAATTCAVVGAYVLYAVGSPDRLRQGARARGKRWFLLLSQADLARGERFLDEHGSKVVLFGRFIPFVRSVVSVPAGFARMPPRTLHPPDRARERVVERTVHLRRLQPRRPMGAGVAVPVSAQPRRPGHDHGCPGRTGRSPSPAFVTGAHQTPQMLDARCALIPARCQPRRRLSPELLALVAP